MAAAAAALHALDELFASVDSQARTIDADECTEWAGVCEVLLARTENLRLAVRSRCDNSALKLLQNTKQAGLARSMSLGGTSSSSLLRNHDRQVSPRASTRPMPARSPVWRPPPPVKPTTHAPPQSDWSSAPNLSFADASAEAGFYAHEVEQLALSASPSCGDFLPQYSASRLTSMSASAYASATRTLANRLSYEAIYKSGFEDEAPSPVKPRVDCWRAGPRAKLTSGATPYLVNRIAARERGRYGVAGPRVK